MAVLGHATSAEPVSPAGGAGRSKDTLEVSQLFAPRIPMRLDLRSVRGGKVVRTDNAWHITGSSPMRIVFAPENKNAGDLSAYRLLSMVFKNNAAGVATITARLENPGSTDWSRCAPGSMVAPAGEQAVLGFPFNLAESAYRGPAVFANQLAKPNGHRIHWREFHPNDVRQITMLINTADKQVDLLMQDPMAAWPAEPELDRKLEQLPYLDTMGQVRVVHWPGKATSLDQAKEELTRELSDAAKSARQLSRYGGSMIAPRRSASGRFRTEKVDGSWWLIDPDGYRFFSVGVCCGGYYSETLVNDLRVTSGFFDYLPQKGDPLHALSRNWSKGRETVNFAALNYARLLGENWDAKARDGVHSRLRSWGLNSLGAWSDKTLQQDRKTPYTLIASPWWKSDGHQAIPEPFDPAFTDKVIASLEQFQWAKDDPFCLGVFLGNELDWPDQFTPLAFELKADSTTKKWVLNHLKKRYDSIDALNAAWKTSHANWDGVLIAKDQKIPTAAQHDIEPLYLEFATEFFKQCKEAVNRALPKTLYLGCRTHRGPALLGKAALGHVDVFSINMYEPEVRTNQIPADVDLPILVSEFHFGAVDRGIPGPGLTAVWDQRQRGLAFCRYLASTLADPRFVGVHWFQWMDQSAAGRPDRENHQCGFVDVTGRSYPEFVAPISRATKALYSARGTGKKSTVEILDELIR